MRISDWSSDVCSSDLTTGAAKLSPASVLRATCSFGTSLAALYQATIASFPAAAIAGPLTGQPAIFQLSACKIGRAPCRERVCQYVWISGVPVSLQKNTYNGL